MDSEIKHIFQNIFFKFMGGAVVEGVVSSV